MSLREDIANLLPLGYTKRDPFADVYETADAILALIAEHETSKHAARPPHPLTMAGRK